MNKLIKITLSVLFFFSVNTYAAGFLWLKNIEHLIPFNDKEHTLQFILVAIVVMFLGLVYRMLTKNKEEKDLVLPDNGISFRNIIEEIGQGMYNLCQEVMDEKRAQQFFPYACFLFFFIFLTNVFGLIPGFSSSTTNFNTTFALGIFSFVYYNFKGIKTQGFKHYMGHFFGPKLPVFLLPISLLIFCIEIISNTIRPLSLALRLKGNITGDHKVLEAFYDLIPHIVPIPFIFLGIFVCFMQAFVFTILSVVYVQMATDLHGHDEEHDHEHGHEHDHGQAHA